MFQCPGWLRKNFIPGNFSWRVAAETWDASYFKKGLVEKQQCSKYLRHIVLKKIFHQNRCIFQISLKYIKLVIPKILFILVLYSFNFYFKIMWPPTTPTPIPITSTHTKIKISNHPSFPPEQRYFWNFYPPSHPLPPSWKEGVHVNVSRYHLRSSTCIFTKNVTLPQVFSNILLVKTNYLVST